ncbi:MAG: MgtC/SapB family protein [Balneolaceae bacterium]
MDSELVILWDLLTALGVGLLIGIERGWKGRVKEEGDRVAGIRTFTLTGLLGGVIGQLTTLAGDWLLATAFISFAIVVAVAHYIGASESEDIGITTPVALLITFSLGLWASFGNHMYVFGVAVVVVALLGHKPEIHKWLRNIESEEIYAGIKLLVISVLLLPLLPNRGFGPWEALNPYWIWWMVVLITGLSFIGFVLIKHFGDRVGILLTSLTGGLASSTAVTFSFAHLAKKSLVKPMLMAGVLFASSIMFVRVAIEVAIVNPLLLHPLWIPLLIMLLITIAGAWWLWKSNTRMEDERDTPIKLDSPFQIRTALKFGFLLGLILVLAAAMKEWFGDEGIYILSIVSGLMDVDAITLSLSRMAMDDLDEKVAVIGIILAVITNTLVKGFIFAFLTNFKDSLKLIFVMIAAGIAGIVSVFFM